MAQYKVGDQVVVVKDAALSVSSGSESKVYQRECGVDVRAVDGRLRLSGDAWHSCLGG